MAQKRASGSTLMDQQKPSPSSSENDYEEASSSSGEETEDEPATPPAPSSATNNPKPNSKKPPPPAAKSQPPASPSDDSATESDSGSGSETDSDNDDPPTASSIPKAKPLAAKSLEESSKQKKPKPQSPLKPSTAQARSAVKSASKRAGESMQNMNDPKKAKKKATDAAGGREDEIPSAADEGGGKKLFQRIWSEEDEIAILKGLAEFTSKTDLDPYKDVNAFHEFIKNSLHWDASSNQLKEKIRRLKKKFENNAGKGKNGEGPKFTKPHEEKTFELSKKVWANGGGSNGGVVEQAKSDVNTKKSKKESNSRTVASPKPKVDPVQHDSEAEKTEAVETGIDENGGSNVHLSEMIRFDNNLGVSVLNEDVMKRGLQLIGASKREELEERWKDLRVAELELYVKRAELIKDQAKLIWEAYKSSNQ